MITLYSTGCPKCKQLERLLDSKHIEYTVCKDIDTMLAIGMREAPALQVGSTIMRFGDAWNWIKQQPEANN